MPIVTAFQIGLLVTYSSGSSRTSSVEAGLGVEPVHGRELPLVDPDRRAEELQPEGALVDQSGHLPQDVVEPLQLPQRDQRTAVRGVFPRPRADVGQRHPLPCRPITRSRSSFPLPGRRSSPNLARVRGRPRHLSRSLSFLRARVERYSEQQRGDPAERYGEPADVCSGHCGRGDGERRTPEPVPEGVPPRCCPRAGCRPRRAWRWRAGRQTPKPTTTAAISTTSPVEKCGVNPRAPWD